MRYCPDELLDARLIARLCDGGQDDNLQVERVVRHYNTDTIVLFISDTHHQKYVVKAGPPSMSVRLREIAGWFERRTPGQAHYLPALFGAVFSGPLPYLVMSHEGDRTLRDLALSGDGRTSLHALNAVIKGVFQEYYLPTRQPPSIECAHTWYVARLSERLAEFDRRLPEYVRFLLAPDLLINGRSCPGPERMMSYLEESLRSVFSQDPIVTIHGDLHLENVLCDIDREVIKLVDPLGVEAGPLSYDLGKVLLSLYCRYDLLHLGLFRMSIQARDVTLTWETEGCFDQLHGAFRQAVQQVGGSLLDEDWEKRARLVAGIHLMCSAPHHYRNRQHSLAMLLRGVECVTEALW